MKTNHEVAHFILHAHGYEKVKIVDTNGYGHCDYKGLNDTTLEINNGKSDLHGNMIAAHEASHFLNYQEGLSDFNRVSKTDTKETVYGVTFLLLIFGTIACSFFDVSAIISQLYLILCSIISCLVMAYYVRETIVYMQDELRTQRRGTNELIKLNTLHGLDLDEPELIKHSESFIFKHIYLNNLVIVGLFLFVLVAHFASALYFLS